MCERESSSVWSGCVPSTRGKIAGVLFNFLSADTSGCVSETCADVLKSLVIKSFGHMFAV